MGLSSMSLTCKPCLLNPCRGTAPAFLGTMPPRTMPWVEEAAFTRLLLHDRSNKPGFHKPDLFHNVHLGQGKAFSASALVCLLPLYDGGSVDAKLAAMSDDFKAFCHAPRAAVTWVRFDPGAHAVVNRIVPFPSPACEFC